jgi:hypothetical protein
MNHGHRRRRGTNQRQRKHFNKIIAEIFPNFEKEMATQVFRASDIQYLKRPVPHYIIVKTLSIYNKERILKAERKTHQVTHKGKANRRTRNFSRETKNEKCRG